MNIDILSLINTPYYKYNSLISSNNLSIQKKDGILNCINHERQLIPPLLPLLLLEAELLQDNLGGESGEDAGDDGAHGGVGGGVAVHRQAEGVLLQVLEQGRPPYRRKDGLGGGGVCIERRNSCLRRRLGLPGS